MKNIKKNKIIIILIFIFLLFIFSTIFSLINIFNNNIINGIYINGINVSNLSKENAKKIIEEKIENKNNFNINFISENNSIKNNYSTISLNKSYNISDVINEAYSIGRSNNIFINNFNIIKYFLFNKNINLKLDLNEENLNKLISTISSDIPDKKINSSYYIENNNLIILKGNSGNIIDENNLKNKIYEYLNNLNISENEFNLNLIFSNPEEINIEKIHDEIYKKSENAYYTQNPFSIHPQINGIDFDLNLAKNILDNSQEEFIIPLTIAYPEITLNNLEINIFPDLLSTFSTKYDVTNKDRATNLDLATSKINGIIISPGETFSYNATLGERTVSSGYKNAKIYSNGKVVDGIGGGICQVSSTLYNTVVFANLQIIERHNHQFITSYVSSGRDATVAYGIKDFKFKNNRTYPIKMVATSNDGIVKISFYGIKEKTEYDISLDSEVISTKNYTTTYEYDSSLEDNIQKIKQIGVNGSTVNTYKIKKINGAIVSKELISTDTYNSLNEIILKKEE